MCVGYVNTVVCLHDTTVAEQTQQFHANTKVLVGNAIQWHHGVTRAPLFYSALYPQCSVHLMQVAYKNF